MTSGTHLLLTGYRGCGKSSVAELLASKLNRPWIDVDLEIEAKANKTIAEIFSEVGESGFRDLESEQLQRLHDLQSPTIIALGGGAILREANRQCIRELGKTVWLTAQPEVLFERIANDANTQARRPKLSSLGELDEIRSILNKRASWYNEVASFIVATDEEPLAGVADRIVAWYQGSSSRR